MTKEIREAYKKEYLDSLIDERDGARICEILTELTNRIHCLKNADLSFEEKDWVFSYLLLTYLKLSIVDYIDINRVFYHEYLKDFRFHFLYIIYLSRDFPKASVAFDFKLRLTSEENRKNELYLESAVDEFCEVIKMTNHKDPLLQAICIEARKPIKKVDTNKKGFGFLLRQEEKRKFAKRYKLLYFNGQSVFRSHDQILFQSQGFKIVFDHKSFAHLGRHFAPALGYAPGKSHFTNHFNPKDIIGQLGSVFLKVGSSMELSLLDNGKGRHMFFELDSICHTIWFENPKVKSNYDLRVSSFYPSTDRKEELRRRSMNRVKIDERLYVFKEDQV